ncbi:MAG: hypothetical protein LBT00_12155 [Spirochaetaceae bacterium]|nr:hypothetical protein [Spirochaetaceae bacterium]
MKMRASLRGGVRGSSLRDGGNIVAVSGEVIQTGKVFPWIASLRSQ